MSGKRADDAQTRKAIKQLKPPSATVVLDDDMLKTLTSHSTQLMQSRGRLRPAVLHQRL